MDQEVESQRLDLIEGRRRDGAYSLWLGIPPELATAFAGIVGGPNRLMSRFGRRDLSLVPSLVASAVLMRRTADPERLRDSVAGRYLRDHMSLRAQGVRALGDVLTAVGAWRRSPALIVLGWAVVAAGWSGGSCMALPLRRRHPIDCNAHALLGNRHGAGVRRGPPPVA